MSNRLRCRYCGKFISQDEVENACEYDDRTCYRCAAENEAMEEAEVLDDEDEAEQAKRE